MIYHSPTPISPIPVWHELSTPGLIAKVPCPQNTSLTNKAHTDRHTLTLRTQNSVFLKLCCFEDKGQDLDVTKYFDSQNKTPDYYYPQYANDVTFKANKDSNNNELFLISKYGDDNSSSSTSSLASRRHLWSMKFWILFSLIYRNVLKFMHSYFSIIIILLPATQALIFCLAVSKEQIPVSTIGLDFCCELMFWLKIA